MMTLWTGFKQQHPISGDKIGPNEKETTVCCYSNTIDSDLLSTKAEYNLSFISDIFSNNSETKATNKQSLRDCKFQASQSSGFFRNFDHQIGTYRYYFKNDFLGWGECY